jgi:dipeptidyl aminopeptidase/acylaminoacyl peptidase
MRKCIIGNLLLAASALLTSVSYAGEKRPIEPADCVTVRYPLYGLQSGQSSVQMNRQGTKVAYLIKTPNIEHNENDIQLIVRDLVDRNQPDRVLFENTAASGLQWLGDGEHVAILAMQSGHVAVVKISVTTGEVEPLIRSQDDITEYGIDDRGETIVYAVEVSKTAVHSHTVTEMQRGYLIPFDEKKDMLDEATRHLFVAKKAGGGLWDKPKELLLHTRFTGEAIRDIPYYAIMFLSVSPDGGSVLIRYENSMLGMPESWRNNAYVKMQLSYNLRSLSMLAQYNLRTGKTNFPIDTPDVAGQARWSSEGQSFIIRAASPVASKWAADDAIADDGAAYHLFVVDPPTKRIARALENSSDKNMQPVFWLPNGTLGIHSPIEDNVSLLSLVDNNWTVKATVRIPEDKFFQYSMTGDERRLIGEYENPSTPPEIVSFDLGSSETTVLSRLNPQFDSLTLAPAAPIEWETSTGYNIRGLLFTPPGYVAGQRYPLLIETKPSRDYFACDNGLGHYPSFIPQPAANAGIVYLSRVYTGDYNAHDEDVHSPKGYPGQLSEAAEQMDVWDSAVKALDRRGVIDPGKVGIIGFSRAGWYTEFALTHGKTKYAAATVADNVEYSVGEYWLNHLPEMIGGFDRMYGGPPYGKSLENWMKYSISFNVDKVNTPVLLESMGYGTPYSSDSNTPRSLALKWELWTGLNRLAKPVELYYYPNEEHAPDHPQARLASLQRNLDWYRFWLQGYERPNPEDPDQYARWRHLRNLQKTSDKTAGNQVQ